MSARVVAILGSGGGAGGSEKRDGHRHDDAACDCAFHFHPVKYKYLEQTRYGMMVLQCAQPVLAQDTRIQGRGIESTERKIATRIEIRVYPYAGMTTPPGLEFRVQHAGEK